MRILAFERAMMTLQSSYTFSKKIQISKNILRKRNIFFENSGFSFLRKNVCDGSELPEVSYDCPPGQPISTILYKVTPLLLRWGKEGG